MEKLKIIDKAIISCKLSKNKFLDHFVEFNKIVSAGVTSKEIIDYKLSRYACYLIVQNGDPRYREEILDNMGSEELLK